MTRRTKVEVALGVAVLALGAAVAVRVDRARNAGTEVRLERVQRRDLVSVVTASGKIQAKSSVDISADITGRIVRIGVREGDQVREGQFLVQIDPSQYQAALDRAQGVLASTRATVLQTKANRDQAERGWRRAQQLVALGPDLIAPEQAEQAQTAYEVAEANYQAALAQLEQARASLDEAREQLAKTRLVSPIAGRVVRLAVEEGEVAVPGTFSRETGLLLTVADLSVMLAEVQADETDVVRLARGDSVEVTIDAYPDTAFVGRVSRVSHSARLAPAGAATGTNDRAVDFDVEVTLVDPPADVRPDLSCTARIVTDTRRDVLSIPILALTTREHERVPNEAGPAVDTARPRGSRRDAEGVFVVRNDVATFRPVRVGIAGDEYFEVLEGLREGEVIAAGSYQAIRDLTDGTRVRAADTTATAAAES